MIVGTVYGVGVGPGDPGLLTVRAVEVLGKVDVVVAPTAGENKNSLALQIARPYVPPECVVITPELPMTDDQAALRGAWERTAELLAREARAGRNAAFITLGDPMLYSTWSYVATALATISPEVPLETVPGITAMAACAAYAGTPLAQGRDPLLVWPDAPPAEMAEVLRTVPNVVFMKAARHLERLAALTETTGSVAVAIRRVGQPSAAATADLRSWAGDSDYFTTVLMHRRDGDAAAASSASGKEGEDL